jgi:hypothetical protein
MSQKNLISFNLSAGDLTDVKNAISVLRTKLMPNLITLSSDDKKELPKMGDKTVAFVAKALEYCKNNSDLVPPFLDVNEFEIDVNAVESLRQMLQPVEQIFDSLNDTIILSGSEAYQAALIFYKSVKAAAASNIQNAGTIYNDLSSRFPGTSKTQNKTTTTTTK